MKPSPLSSGYPTMPRLGESAAKNFKLLVADPDSQTVELVRSTLSIGNFKILAASEAQQAASLFAQSRPQLVLLAAELSRSSSLELVQMFVTADEAVDVILTAPEYSSSAAVNAIQRGACDFLTKPLDPAKLRQRVFSLVAEASNRRRTLELNHELIRECQVEGIIGQSPVMLDLFMKIRRLAPHFQTALLTGATGTGKELVARALHGLSSVKEGPFVVCHCSVLAHALLERELFGYMKGAFSAANQDNAGLIESAAGGTLFLDEVSDIPWQTQGKLVRLLERHETQRAGSSISKKIELKVIGATHRDVPALISDGKFRQDFYRRLTEAQIRLPLLSDRKEDLPLLQRHLLERHSARYGRDIKGITRRAQRCLARYSWPGNVRELDGIIAQACMLAKGEIVDLHDLPEHVRNEANGNTIGASEILPMRELERRHLQYVLRRMSGNKAKAAMVLGISRATVYEMLSRMKQEQRSGNTSASKSAS
jgi:DNA-binding NtrC family response regulator